MKKPKPTRSILAENIRAWRKAQGVSQEKLGEIAGLHRTYISQLERQQLNVTLDTLEQLAAVLRVSVGTLLTEEQP